MTLEENLYPRLITLTQRTMPRLTGPNKNASDWWKAIYLSTQALLKKTKINPKEVSCISFSGQMMGCLPVNKKGIPLRKAIIWADQRAEPQASTFRKRIGKKSL